MSNYYFDDHNGFACEASPPPRGGLGRRQFLILKGITKKFLIANCSLFIAN